jgi:hypothetical protein
MSDYVRQITSTIDLKKRIKTYVDVSLSFNPSPITNDITVLTNEKAINNSIKNIIMFLPTEVPFNPEIGSMTQRYLFDIVDEPTAGLLAEEIQRAVIYCEPRVTFFSINPDEVNVSELYASNTQSVQLQAQQADLFQDDLGVSVEIQPDQNNFAVTVKYRIIGDEKIFKVQEILTPTR